METPIVIEHRDALAYMLNEAAELEHGICCQYLFAAFSLKDAEGFESLREAEPIMDEEDIVPRPQDFSTVGHLYRSIEKGFERLTDRHGEEWLFIGDERSQATSQAFWWPELVAVTDLQSAKAAIEIVVEQGEGPRGHWRDAHYGRLLEVLGEFLTIRKQDPSFEPARPVLAAYSRQPVDVAVDVLIGDPLTSRVMDIFNVSYEVLLYTLARFFAHGHEDDVQLQVLADVSVGLMVSVIAPVGNLVTTLPIGDQHPGMRAGPAFEVFHRSGFVLPHTWQAWVVIHERLRELQGFVERIWEIEGCPSDLTGIGTAIDGLTKKLEEHMPKIGDRTIRPLRS